MRYYAIVILLFAVLGCRSSKHSTVLLDEQSQEESHGSTTRTDSSSHSEYAADSKKSLEWERQFIRAIYFDSLGRISYLQESWRDAGSGQLDTSERGSGGISLKSEKKDSANIRKKDIKLTQLSSSQTDNRLLQGGDWVWLAVALILLLTYLKYRNK